MNVKRFTARTSRDALALVRQAFGDDAVVMSTKPCADGVEVLAMAPESVQQLERVGASAPLVAAPSRPAPPLAVPSGGHARPAPRRDAAKAAPVRHEPSLDAPAVDNVASDIEQLEMSTLSFQDYVRDRMLKRRQAELDATAAAQPQPQPKAIAAASIEAARARREPPVLRDEIRIAAAAAPAAVPPPPPLFADAAPPLRSAEPNAEMLQELRSMRGLIEQRFGALAFMEKLQRQPRQATLTQKLLESGFSPALARKLVEGLPADGDEVAWAAGVLERNLHTGEHEPALEELGGVYALIGATGVGKTTSTAKLAAAFATRHGAANLGLITLDAYRVGAHEQLRTYGRILGVPVHTAHDRASLDDLLELLAAKRMVLIDTAGMAQRDERTKELLEMLSHRAINRLLVVNAAAQGETIDEVLAAYNAPACRGIVVSKMDEAVKLGPVLDALIRSRLRVLAVANGQRVPEDWHRLTASSLVQRALKGGGNAAWKMDAADMNLVFAGAPSIAARAGSAAAAAV